ncbi:hypothetical protein FRC06_006449 [Ceratobasidium sp. 370]|nr:hypothetical protein FRC06_006449 [Ceratobasidium sp. 370]
MCLHKWTQHIADIGRHELSATVPDALNYLSQPSITETEASHRSFLRVVADLPPNVPKRRVRPEAFVRGDVDRFERRPLKARNPAWSMGSKGVAGGCLLILFRDH